MRTVFKLPKKIMLYYKVGNVVKSYITTDRKEIEQVINTKNKLRGKFFKFKVLA
jgi:hypothetical protein